jgi:predicted enzyme related to lactoylglutathione lyase
MQFAFDAVFYYVSNLSAAIDFYSGTLGFCLTSRDAVARFHIDGVLFELVPTSDASKLRENGNARLCLRVVSVVEALQELQGRGVHTSTAECKENGVLASFWDPDGNELCLWEYAG